MAKAGIEAGVWRAPHGNPLDGTSPVKQICGRHD